MALRWATDATLLRPQRRCTTVHRRSERVFLSPVEFRIGHDPPIRKPWRVSLNADLQDCDGFRAGTFRAHLKRQHGAEQRNCVTVRIASEAQGGPSRFSSTWWSRFARTADWITGALRDHISPAMRLRWGARVNYVGISHYHGDHTGQAASFPQATLLIGKAIGMCSRARRLQGANAAPLKHWLGGEGKAEPVAKTKTCSATAWSSCWTCRDTRRAITACW